MKKFGFVLLVSVTLLLSACFKSEVEKNMEAALELVKAGKFPDSDEVKQIVDLANSLAKKSDDFMVIKKYSQDIKFTHARRVYENILDNMIKQEISEGYDGYNPLYIAEIVQMVMDKHAQELVEGLDTEHLSVLTPVKKEFLNKSIPLIAFGLKKKMEGTGSSCYPVPRNQGSVPLKEYKNVIENINIDASDSPQVYGIPFRNKKLLQELLDIKVCPT